jgi:hypothetical protein
MIRKPVSLFIALALIAAPAAALAAERIYSYDPANPRTRGYVDNGLTFIFDKNFLGFRVKEVLSTQAAASAKVEEVAERELGVRLDQILPKDAYERALYRIESDGQGPAMVHAFCPGSTKGWLVFGPLRPRQDVTVHALGDDPVTGKAKLCASLNFSFRGEWALPKGDPRMPDMPPGFRLGR